ncbi:MAG: peptidoglycan-binding domain-containing protein [Candidatus Omnitrophota bacterium]
MLKIIGIILAVIIIGRIVIGPVHSYINNLIQVNKAESEEQFIGLVTRHNSRVEEIQQILKVADFNLGPVDGMMGAQTRGAIKEFQKANQLKPTGKIDPATWTALNQEKEVLQHEQKIGEPAEKVIPEASVTVNSVGLGSTKENVEKKTEPQVEIIGYRLKTKDRIRQIQIALKKAGFYQGEIDSKIGSKTKKAIIDFQRSKKLKPDGVIGLKTWEELKGI